MNSLLKIYKLKMEKQAAMKPIKIKPNRVFGLRNDIVGNVHFTTGQEVLYPVAGVLVIQDFVTNEQKILRFPETSQPTIIVISPNRKLIAVAEKSTLHEKTVVNIYEVESLEKVKTLKLPTECPVIGVGNMCFTFDSKGIAVLSGKEELDAYICIYTFDKNDTLVTGRASNRNLQGRATLLSCNPGDVSIIAVGGENMLKIMNKTEKGFGQLGTIKGEHIVVTSLAWLSAEIIVAGSAEMELYFVEGGDLKAKYKALELEMFDLSIQAEGEEVSKADLMLSSYASVFLKKETYPILCLTSFPLGFAFSTNNVVHVFERETNIKYTKKTMLTIPVIYDESLYIIRNIAINDQQDTITVTTDHSQIYIGKLFVPETLDVTHLELKHLGEPLHINSITGLSVCSWKPIAVTASKDHTIRIWNYETMKVELVKKYLIDIQVIALHPSGMFMAVGFTDVLRIMQIQLSDLKVTKSLNYPMCSVIEFSNRGHLLAASCEKVIAIISVFTFETIMTLRGHNGSILSMTWSTDDKFLVSSGQGYELYEWSLETGKRVNELVQKGTKYRSLAVANDQSYIIGATHSGLIREISKSQIVREFKTPDETSPLTSIAFSRSDQMLFAANEKGCLYNVKMPFMESDGGFCTNYRFFHTSVNKLCVTYDDMMLISVAADGTLVFWTIENAEHKAAPVDPNLMICEDVLISRQELIGKNKKINLLTLRIAEQVAEFLYQKKQGDNFHSEEIREIHEKYCAAIEDLKQKNDALQAQHTDQLNELTTSITKANEKHMRELANLEASFNEKIIVEYENTAFIKQKMADMREDYEEQLNKSQICLQDTIVSLDKGFKKQLDEREAYIQQLMRDIQEKEKQVTEYCKQVEIDNDRNMVESQLSYEKRIKECEEIITRWRGDAGVLKKRNTTTSKECEELRKEIETLRGQHSRFQQSIRSYQKDVEDLKKEIQDREATIKNNEKRLNECQKKNQELDKYKQVLTHKLNELKAEIEPRELEIKDKKEQIFEMERELKTLQQTSLHTTLKLSELKDKYFGSEKELKLERIRSRTARAQMSRVCADIFEVSNYIQKPEKLKDEVKNLYHRYANDPELRKTLTLDTDVQNEFMRHREHFEKMLSDNKSKQVTKKTDPDSLKLLKENVSLITELNKLREQLHVKSKQNAQMEEILGVSSKYMPNKEARKKLEKAVMDKGAIENKYLQEIEKLHEKIKTLVTENVDLRSQLVDKL